MEKISKREARRRFETHKPFIMVPANFRPDSFAAVTISERGHENETFDTLYNSFLYYNSGLSRRVAFYVA